ncbi:MAG: ABC transporter permease subunit, partial [Gemmatimonadota bacterium]|nr:ABC transporter permease subunit [Gemmatimonadota bacterium]
AAHLLSVLPLPIPHLVAAAAGVLLLSQSGVLARLAYAVGLINGPAQMPLVVGDPAGVGFVLTLAWKEFPFLALVTFSLLATRGPAMEEAARTLGATPRQTFRRVTMPMLSRGLLPAIIVVFIVIAGSYEAGALLSGSHPQPLPVLTYERYLDVDLSRRGDAYALTLLGLVIGVTAVALHEWARAWSDDGG